MVYQHKGYRKHITEMVRDLDAEIGAIEATGRAYTMPNEPMSYASPNKNMLYIHRYRPEPLGVMYVLVRKRIGEDRAWDQMMHRAWLGEPVD
jgi:hypothetical protein